MLRIVSSDEATVRLLEDIDPPPAGLRESRREGVPVPKSMALMGYEALEAAEVSAGAGKENSSASKAMAKFGVDFHRPEEEKEQDARRVRSYKGMAVDATRMLRLKRLSQSIAGPKQMDVMGFEAREAFEVAASIRSAAAETDARAALLESSSLIQNASGDEGDDGEETVIRRRSTRRRSSNAKVMETLGVAYSEGERSQKLAQTAKSSRRRKSDKANGSMGSRGKRFGCSSAMEVASVTQKDKRSKFRRPSSWSWVRTPSSAATPVEYEPIQPRVGSPPHAPTTIPSQRADTEDPDEGTLPSRSPSKVRPHVTDEVLSSLPGFCPPGFNPGRHPSGSPHSIHASRGPSNASLSPASIHPSRRPSNASSVLPGPEPSRRPSLNLQAEDFMTLDGIQLAELAASLAAAEALPLTPDSTRSNTPRFMPRAHEGGGGFEGSSGYASSGWPSDDSWPSSRAPSPPPLREAGGGKAGHVFLRDPWDVPAPLGSGKAGRFAPWDPVDDPSKPPAASSSMASRIAHRRLQRLTTIPGSTPRVDGLDV